MDLFIVFVYLICAILSLVLFFKIWGMTNDVELIQKSVCKKSPSAWVRVKHLIFLGKTEEAYQELNSLFLDQIEYVSTRCPNNSDRERVFTNGLASAIEIFKPWYDAIGKEIPSELKNLTASKYIDYPPKS